MLDILQWVSNKVHTIKFRLHCFELRAYHTSCKYVPMPKKIKIQISVYKIQKAVVFLTDILPSSIDEHLNFMLYIWKLISEVFASFCKFHVLVRFFALLNRWRFYAVWKLICGFFAPFSRLYALGIFLPSSTYGGFDAEIWKLIRGFFAPLCRFFMPLAYFLRFYPEIWKLICAASWWNAYCKPKVSKCKSIAAAERVLFIGSVVKSYHT